MNWRQKLNWCLDPYWREEFFREKANDFLIWSIGFVNRHKDECLAHRLHEASLRYRRRPDEWK